MNVSVVIPARNEAENIDRCLSALVEQVCTHPFVVILVDNGSTDDTYIMAAKWAKDLDLVIVREDQVGRGAARQTGFARASTDIVLSTDADSEVPPNWVEILTNELLENEDTVACTTVCFITDGTWVTNLTMSLCMPLCLFLYRLIAGHYLLTGSTFAVRRAAYERAGGFDRACVDLEDVDLAMRLALLGRIRQLWRPRVKTFGIVFRYGFLRGFTSYFRIYLSRYVK